MSLALHFSLIRSTTTRWAIRSPPQLFRKSNIPPLLRSQHHRSRVSRVSSRNYTSTSFNMTDSRPTQSRAAGQQLVQYGGREYMAVKEGLAYILNPPSQDAASKAPPARRDPKDDDEPQSVFYNPIQQFNRDLSVLAIRAYGEHVLALKKQKAEKWKQKAAKGGFAKGKKRKREDSDGEVKAMEPNGGHAQGDVEKADDDDASASASGLPSEQNAAPSFTILDALSATGLRALRYASEIPFTTCVVANDLSPSAIQSMKINIEYNGLEKLIRPNTGDARAYMYSLLNPSHQNGSAAHISKFDVVDLDPYGSAAPFMDAAVQGVKDGGLLCVTCTDAGVFASNGYPEKAFALYGGIPSKGSHSHEAGLRIILHGLATSAAKYGLAMEPLLSLSIDFYARVFVRIHKSPASVKFLSGNTMLVYNCDSGCGAWSTQPLTQTKTKLDKKGNPFYHYGFAQGPVSGPHCEHCGFKTHIGGPMWAGPLHNPHFIQKILDMLPGADRDIYHTVDRIEGMLTTALEEDLDLAIPAKEPPTPAAESSGGDHIVADADADADADATVQPSGESSAIIPRLDPAAVDPHPFYFNLSALCKVLHVSTISLDAFRGALRHLGYRSTRSHAKPNTVRTDAPWEVIWEILREWARQKAPIKEGAIRPGTPGAAIMSKSRENLRKNLGGEEGGDPWLWLLKKEVMSAVESGRDVGDLVTKIEAALYRSASRPAGSNLHGQEGEAASKEKSQGHEEESAQAPKGETPGKPHPSTLEVVFDEALGREASKKRLVRYQINPRANWGPLSRAVGRSKS